MPREHVKETWKYSLEDVSEDKRAARMAVPRTLCPEIVGADLRVPGGVRRDPGFIVERKLGRTQDDVGVRGTDDGVLNAGDIWTTGTELLDFQMVDLKVGPSNNIRGVVYRVENGTNRTIIWEFYDDIGILSESEASVGTTGVYRSEVLVTYTHSGGEEKHWSAVANGRLLYLFIEGETPRLWYTQAFGATPDYQSVVLTDTGPGAKPGAPTISLFFNSWDELQTGDGGNKIPITEFPFYTGSGTPWDPANVVTYDPKDIIRPGAYNVAYRLRDSVTGRKSMISELATLNELEFVEYVPFTREIRWNPSTETYDEYLTERSVPVPQELRAHTFGIDRTKWDQLELYRSVRVGAPGGEEKAGVLYLDSIQDLAEESTTHTDTNFRWPESGEYSDFLDDLALSTQRPYADAETFRESPPKAGAAKLYRNSVFVSKISDDDADDNENVGELRWSTLTERNIELFPPSNRFVSEISPSDEVIRFELLGDTLVCMTRSRLYQSTASGNYVVFSEMHEGFGITGRYASTKVSSSIVYCTNEGFKELQLNGRLINVKVLDNLLQNEWFEDRSDLVVIHDAPTSRTMILNPNKQEIVCMWQGSRKISELHYCPFVHAAEGLRIREPGERRSFFGTRQGYLLRTDDERAKAYVSAPSHAGHQGESEVALWNTDGDKVVTLNSASAGAATVVCGAVATADSSIELGDVRDCLLYIEDETGILTKQIKSSTGSLLTMHDNFTASEASRFNAAEYAIICPLVFSVTLASVGLWNQQGADGMADSDKFRQRIVNQVGCHFQGLAGPGFNSDVSAGGGGAPDIQNYTVAFLKGLADEEIHATASGSLTLNNGPGRGRVQLSGTAYDGVRGAALFPKVRVVTPDVDFWLVSVAITGTISSTDVPEE